MFLLISEAANSADADLEKYCQSNFRKPCDQITKQEFESTCTFETFKWSAGGKIIGWAWGERNPKTSTKLGDILEVRETSVGCAHAQSTAKYYIKKNINFDKITCGQVVEMWNNLIAKKQEAEPVSASKPQKLISEDNSCYDTEKTAYLTINKSDLKDYSFYIMEVREY